MCSFFRPSTRFLIFDVALLLKSLKTPGFKLRIGELSLDPSPRAACHPWPSEIQNMVFVDLDSEQDAIRQSFGVLPSWTCSCQTPTISCVYSYCLQ